MREASPQHDATTTMTYVWHGVFMCSVLITSNVASSLLLPLDLLQSPTTLARCHVRFFSFLFATHKALTSEAPVEHQSYT